jgi:hypothetical protein
MAAPASTAGKEPPIAKESGSIEIADRLIDSITERFYLLPALMGSRRSESFEMTTATSNRPIWASCNKCVARFTSERAEFMIEGERERAVLVGNEIVQTRSWRFGFTAQQERELNQPQAGNGTAFVFDQPENGSLPRKHF